MASAFSIPLAEANSIIDQVRSAVDRWREFAEDSGVGRTSRNRIGTVIAPRRAGKKP
jgi:serine/threonine-protein kinase HipA